MPKKPSPNRRRSIAVTNQNQPSIVPKGRRRAHSIVPGAKLSPLAKARRSLAPRKSILKASLLNIESQSQQSSTQSQSFVEDDATCSMDFTQDFTALVHDNTSRKSLGRRVSFAERSHVRFFEKKKNHSIGSSQASPPDSESPNARAVANENDYPKKRRGSSVRYSIAGSVDMDMTSIAPGAFQARGSAILDEELSYEDEGSYEDDMDVTQALHGDFARKRSLSYGGRRQSLSQLQSPSTTDSDDPNGSRSDIGDESIQSDQSQVMDFTIPVGQSLRPAEKDEAWLALKRVTHSGNDPSEPEPSSDDMAHEHGDEDMNLDDAMVRLKRARDSMSLSQTQEAHDNHDDTFTSEENSFEDEFDANKTLNLSRVLGRTSLAASRMSMGQDSNMDESEVYGNIVAHIQPTPRQSLVPQSRPSEPLQRRKSSVFQPPAPQNDNPDAEQLASESAKPSATTSSTAFASTPRSPSPTKSSNTPSKTKPKPTFSAAFAPPVTRPSPKKPDSSSASRTSLAKRPRPSNQGEIDMDIDKPSPAKRQALAGKWLGVAEPANEDSPTPAPAAKTAPKPRPLSPSKRAPFQSSAAASAESTSRPPSALRRPSGYFAKRKSLAVSFSVPPTNEPTPSVTVSSPKKKPGIGMGRASVGSGASDAWTRFNKAAGSGVSEKASGKQKNSDKEAEAEACVRESARQASASPSPTRGSPAPAQRQPTQQNFQQDERSPSPEILSQAEANDDFPDVQDNDDHSGKMEIDVDATRQWREGVEPAKYDEEDDTPAISVAQFFAMTGIKFMDEVTAPRRSMHPSRQPIRQPRNLADIPLAEYVTAMGIDIPQLELYSRVSKDLEAWMAKSEIVFAQAEEEATKLTPELFVEYARADEEGQAELLHQLKLIRTHTRYLARSDWYDWKLQWVEGLRVMADDAFASLENDARALEEPKKLIVDVIPELEREYEELMRELEKEQAEVTEIEAGDQDYLNELKATIAEQNIEIEALKAELSEGTDQVRWLQERMNEIEVQKREAKNTINTAERVLRMKQTSTRSEVFRLKGELEALEDLHMFRITKVNSNLFEYVYSSLFQVSIPCKNFMPIVTKVNITYHGKANSRYKDDFPRLSAFLLASANQYITEGDDLTVREIVHRLSDYWSACAQLRMQLTLLSIKYPVDIIIPSMPKDSPPTFHARAMVMFPSVMGKAFISFVFPFDTFGQWPMSIDSLDCDVEVAYGPMDRSTIMQAVVSRLSQASPSDNYACFLDACIEAQDVYH